MSVAAVAGFNQYSLPTSASYPSWKRIKQIQAIALAAIAVVATLFAFSLSVPLGLAFSALTAYALLRVRGIAWIAPPSPATETIVPLGQKYEHPCIGFPTQDGIDSQRWKEKLIETADHSIVLSGCYCGGSLFDETLSLIAKQLTAKPQLQVVILSSDQMISRKNRDHLNQLARAFPHRLHAQITPEVFPYVSPATGKLTMSTNHTKALIIDGSSFLIGGSGIVDVWGRQSGEDAPQNTESHGLLYDMLLSEAYRDMDFVVHDPRQNGIAERLQTEILNLFNRFRHPLPPVAAPKPTTPPPTPPFFGGAPNDLQISLFATGPDQKNNPFLQEIISQINKARTSIVINHMYFHPSKEMALALQKALDRGVDVTILTNSHDRSSPGSHSLFAELSRYSWKKLFQGKPRDNLHIYEYGKHKTTLHKKAIIIDGETSLIGSANIGAKSLEALADYEIDCTVQSASFSSEVLSVIEKDKALCKKIDPLQAPKISLKTRIMAIAQRLLFKPFL